MHIVLSSDHVQAAGVIRYYSIDYEIILFLVLLNTVCLVSDLRGIIGTPVPLRRGVITLHLRRLALLIMD